MKINKPIFYKSIVSIILFILILFINIFFLLKFKYLIKLNSLELILTSIVIAIVIIDCAFMVLNIKVYNVLFIISYIITIYMILYNRPTNNELIQASDFYLFNWLKIIFSSKTVLINIIGNIALFIPLGIYLNQIINEFSIKLSIALIIIISLETLQYLAKKGVFDIIDIILNLIGVIISLTFLNNKLFKNIIKI